MDDKFFDSCNLINCEIVLILLSTDVLKLISCLIFRIISVLDYILILLMFFKFKFKFKFKLQTLLLLLLIKYNSKFVLKYFLLKFM